MSVRRASFALLAVLAAASLSNAGSPAAQSTSASAGLRFGVYPWGAVGCAGRCAPSAPENADKSLAAVKELQGDRSFVVHLYGDYTGRSEDSAEALMSEARWWASHGLQIAAVLRYRPADRQAAAGYAPWVRTQTRRLAALATTVSIQIGNEPNNMSPGAGDGSYPGVIGAIAGAIPAARDEVVAAGRPDIQIGFNWAAGERPSETEPMWSALRQAGGTAFATSVGFVGVNVYPGTWSPPARGIAPSAAQVEASVRAAITAVRDRHMVAAGLGGVSARTAAARSRRAARARAKRRKAAGRAKRLKACKKGRVRRGKACVRPPVSIPPVTAPPATGSTAPAIIIGETGYPTTPTRTEATQDVVFKGIVAAAQSMRVTHGVTDLYWFSLRDGNTDSGQLENGYGLLRDDYRRKPAFSTLKRLVAESG